MAQVNVGDLVVVQGLERCQHYNGRRGTVVKTLIENKFEVKLVAENRYPVEMHLILKMQCLHVVASSSSPVLAQTLQLAVDPRRCSLGPDDAALAQTLQLARFRVPMNWGSAESRSQFEENWKQRVHSMDPVWLTLGKNNVYP